MFLFVWYDAAGFFYQWGRKDPFTFATKASGISEANGLNPVKIYNAQGKEIVQTLNGLSDTNGGITIVTEQASSMLETIKKPNTFYATGLNSAMINPKDLTKDVWDYYWTSYSRGTDGTYGNTNWNNEYLNGYTQERIKSVFDPCPYQFRLPTNGVFNRLAKTYHETARSTYVSGVRYIEIKSIWLPNQGYRDAGNGSIVEIGNQLGSRQATRYGANGVYSIRVDNIGQVEHNTNWSLSSGASIRCIEDAKKRG